MPRWRAGPPRSAVVEHHALRCPTTSQMRAKLSVCDFLSAAPHARKPRAPSTPHAPAPAMPENASASPTPSFRRTNRTATHPMRPTRSPLARSSNTLPAGPQFFLSRFPPFIYQTRTTSRRPSFGKQKIEVTANQITGSLPKQALHPIAGLNSGPAGAAVPGRRPRCGWCERGVVVFFYKKGEKDIKKKQN